MQMQPTENIKKMKKQKVLHRLNDWLFSKP
jgi:hypothetical protein